MRRGGRICVLGAFGGEAAIPAQGLIGRESRIVGAWGYGYIGGHADYDVALELLRRFGDVLGNLITHHVPWPTSSAAFSWRRTSRAGRSRSQSNP